MRVAADGTTVLISRNNNDFTGRFPELAGALTGALGVRRAVLDGEIVALDDDGRPDFGLLQNHDTSGRAVAYFVFDVLQLGDDVLLERSYGERAALDRRPGAKCQAPDRLVFDLDPGEGASVVECARVAERLLEFLTADGLTPLPKASGSKGLQVCCGVRTRRPERTSAYAKAIAEQLACEMPQLVVAKMAKNLRVNKVFIDWSQNSPTKTTIAAYSLGGRDAPTASTPITWDEVRACRTPAELTFTADDVLHRIDERGDLLADLHDTRVALPGR